MDPLWFGDLRSERNLCKVLHVWLDVNSQQFLYVWFRSRWRKINVGLHRQQFRMKLLINTTCKAQLSSYFCMSSRVLNTSGTYWTSGFFRMTTASNKAASLPSTIRAWIRHHDSPQSTGVPKRPVGVLLPSTIPYVLWKKLPASGGSLW